jgi:hypothetical protein
LAIEDPTRFGGLWLDESMKYCRFQVDGQASYGLVESVAGREMITR